LSTAQRRGWPLIAGIALAMRCITFNHMGAVSDAIADAREALVVSNDLWITPFAVAYLMHALIERGEPEGAEAELVVRGWSGDLPGTWQYCVLRESRGHLLHALGRPSAAAAELIDLGRDVEAWGVFNPAMLPWRLRAALALVAAGEAGRARPLADEDVRRAREWGAPRALGMALHAAGLTREGRERLGLLRQAAAVLGNSPAPLEHARALTDLGAALRRDGERSNARVHLRQALDLAHRLGGHARADRAREELRIAGGRPRRDALRGRDALTAGELRVARMAGEGLSNAQIAQALFVTLRTVEQHLTHIYTKLNIASRAQLAQALDSRATEGRVPPQVAPRST
jgi:DNA-binding CsgD family transcriptional regulator